MVRNSWTRWLQFFRARLWHFSRLKRRPQCRRLASNLAFPIDVLESRVLLAAAVADSFSIQRPALSEQFPVLANDTGDHPTIISVTQPGHGTTEIRPVVTNSVWEDWLYYAGENPGVTFSWWYQYENGNDPSQLNWKVLYTPTAGFNSGSDSFSYTISDAAGQSTASVAVTVLPPPNQPATVSLLNPVLTLSENASTATAIKVATIVITDDGQGTNTLALSGAG
jgi:hypothetical protein